MDPVSVVVTALAAGAAAGLKPAAEQVVKDAYAGLKALIQRKWQQVSVNQLEANPASEARQAVVKEDLARTNAANDRDLLALADKVLDAVAQHARVAAAGRGFDGFGRGGRFHWNLQHGLLKGAAQRRSDSLAHSGVSFRIGHDVDVVGIDDEHRRSGVRGEEAFIGEAQAGKLFHVRRTEIEGTEFLDREAQVRPDALGIGEGVEDGRNHCRVHSNPAPARSVFRAGPSF